MKYRNFKLSSSVGHNCAQHISHPAFTSQRLCPNVHPKLVFYTKNMLFRDHGSHRNNAAFDLKSGVRGDLSCIFQPYGRFLAVPAQLGGRE